MKIILIASLIATLSTALAGDGVIRVEQGLVTGAPGKNASVRVYKGLPYARPPVGELRWKPPQPPASWTGVRDATKFSPACLQEPHGGKPIHPAGTPDSEDCLYLNIWTAAQPRGLFP